MKPPDPIASSAGAGGVAGFDGSAGWEDGGRNLQGDEIARPEAEARNAQHRGGCFDWREG
ncbi:MAG: hypothetical protein ACRD2G_14640 [Terriglobia bacterium]